MSNDKDETGRERAAFAALVEEAEGSQESLDTETIWDAVAGDLSPDETGRLLDRAGGSPEVAEAWRLARELQAAAAEHASGEGDEGSGPYSRRWGRGAYWAGIAATLLLAIGLWPGLWDRSVPEEPPVYRSTDGEGLVSLIEEGIALPRESFLLRWSPAEGQGWSYELRVSTRDLEELARARDLADSEYRVPSAALEASESGSQLYWRVEAQHEDGRRQASPTFIVSLR